VSESPPTTSDLSVVIDTSLGLRTVRVALWALPFTLETNVTVVF
jgi:hypothetical protein